MARLRVIQRRPTRARRAKGNPASPKMILLGSRFDRFDRSLEE
jgi:hypothetical protein